MSRVRCNYCDRRAETPERIEHTKGCPFAADKQSCRECGGVHVHKPRCPLIHERRGASR